MKTRFVINRCENCLTSFDSIIEVYKQEKLICKKCSKKYSWVEKLKNSQNEH
jgi:formylmethanofuran dehydrogenase subunit E